MAVKASFFRMSATRKALKIVESTAGAPGYFSSSCVVPPAASMAACADFEKRGRGWSAAW
jgi:hypothetical protein